MCGISGFCNLHTDFLEREPYYRNILSDMSDALYHRGPDSHGIYLTSHTGFSHTRLAIIDPHGGLQPMTRHYCDADFTIVYNGELYNTKELREELVSHGMTFRTHSDTEVILNGFLFEGPSFVRKMNGIFAFAIYDEAHQLLYLFRDAFGVKPLFYRLFHDTLIFSSEPKGIFCYPGCIPSVNKTGLCEIFGLGPARNPGNAVYEHMAECLPGHYLTFSASGLKDYCYFRLESHPHTDSYKETVVHTKELLLQSIRRQMVSDVPICTFLSGGLDSSLVSSVCAEELKKDGQTLSTYSFDFTDNSRYFKANDFQPSEDRPFVDIMKNYLKSEHQYLTCDNRSQADLLFASMKAHDLPCMADVDSSLLFFCREVSKQHKVVLTGECADEVFGGYPWFHRKNFLSCNTFPWTPDLSFRKSFLKDEIADALSLDSYVQSSYENAIAKVDILPSDNDTECSRRRISYLNIRYFMQTLLNRMDRTSMFSGLEARVPFADKNLVSYVFNVPWEMKAKDGLVKNLLRQCAKDYLPDTITFRKKSPYPKTYHPYYEQLLRQRLSALLTTGESPLLALIDKEKTMQFLNQEGDYGKPWYGQLMAGPQMIAYLLQIHYWLSEYKIDLHL